MRWWLDDTFALIREAAPAWLLAGFLLLFVGLQSYGLAATSDETAVEAASSAVESVEDQSPVSTLAAEEPPSTTLSDVPSTTIPDETTTTAALTASTTATTSTPATTRRTTTTRSSTSVRPATTTTDAPESTVFEAPKVRVLDQGPVGWVIEATAGTESVEFVASNSISGRRSVTVLAGETMLINGGARSGDLVVSVDGVTLVSVKGIVETVPPTFETTTTTEEQETTASIEDSTKTENQS